MKHNCDKCWIKKSHDRLGFYVDGQLTKCLSCKKVDLPKGGRGNVVLE